MKATDLMIGDWVLVDKVPIKIKQVCEDCIISDFGDGDEEVDCFEPIPLTPEILEKNGFEPDCDKKIYKNKSYGSDIRIRHFLGDFSFGEMLYCYDTPQFNSWFSVSYVHKLQHALKLCVMDKEIVL